MTRLRTCDACARHVFATESSCPFCHAQLSAAPEVAQLAVPAGASRAQRLALAAAISGSALLGCAQDGDNAQSTDNTSTAGAPAAGAAAAGRSGGNTSQQPGGTVTPVYGAPVPGNPPGQGGRVAQPTAGKGNEPVAMPAYGAPVAGAPAEDEDAGVPEAGASGAAGAAGSGGTSGQAGRGSVPQAGTVAVPVYGAPIPEYGAPPPPKD
jgi:hypothetical protein